MKYLLLIISLSFSISIFSNEKSINKEENKQYSFSQKQITFNTSQLLINKYKVNNSKLPKSAGSLNSDPFTKFIIISSVVVTIIGSIGIMFPFTLGWAFIGNRFPEYVESVTKNWVLFGFGTFGVISFFTFEMLLGMFKPVAGAIAGWILTACYATVCTVAVSMFIDSRLNSSHYDVYYNESLNLIVPTSAAVLSAFLIPTIIFSIVGAIKNKKTDKDNDKNVALKKYIIEPYDLGIKIMFN